MAQKRRNSRSKESINDRIRNYLPSKEILKEFKEIDSISLERRDYTEKNSPGAKYSLKYFPQEHKFIILPSWHRLNQEQVPNSGRDYSINAFEGLSVEPVVKKGGLKAANLILLEPRMKRLQKSVEALKIQLPFNLEDFKQGIIDLASILGTDILISKEGKISRAYVRPTFGAERGKWGLSSTEQDIEAGALIWNWPYYLKDPERVYKGSGAIAGIFVEQRISPIRGKLSSNYTEARRISQLAHSMGVDEALLFGPYLIDPYTGGKEEKEDINVYRPGMHIKKANDLFAFGVIADGPGEEIFAITKNGELWYPPMDVNRLGGTTLDYIVKCMAPVLGIKTVERGFNLTDVKDGNIISMAFAGNAVRVAPIGEIRAYFNPPKIHHKYNLDVSPILRQIVDRYEDEVHGVVKPSSPTLLTPIDLQNGLKARESLDEAYKEWF